MNLEKLFKMQKALDERILREKRLEGQDLLPNKILALQVELGELANEWQGFKHWKVNPEPKEKVLEEYVDCLHFILSIGLEKEFDKEEFEYLHEANYEIYTNYDVLGQFISLMSNIFEFYDRGMIYEYEDIFIYFIGLGRALGFTWEQIEKAYMDKNKVNHQRQENGY